MPDSPNNPLAERQAKLLTVALELFRRTLADSVSFMFANRDRKTAIPEWARESIQTPRQDFPAPTIPLAPINQRPVPLAKDTPAPNVFNLTPQDTSKPELPPIPLAGTKRETFEIRKEVQSLSGGFGLGDPKTSNVSAFDKPISAIIVGPKPLPVTFDKALAMPATTPRAQRESQGEAAAGGGVAKAIAARFLAVMAPLYALSTILGQTNSGFSVFQKSINVLGASLAPILLPVFVLLASGIMTVADILWNKIAPGLEKFYEWILKVAVPIAGKSLENTSNTIDAFGNLAQGKVRARDAAAMTDPVGANRIAADFLKKIPGMQTAFPVLNFMGSSAPIQRQIDKEAKQENEKRAERGESPLPSFGQRLSDNMKLVIQSLSREMGPKASYSGLGEVGKQAQLAALNVDPVEMKAAQRVIESIKAFQTAFERMANKEPGKEQINRRYPDGAGIGPTGGRVR